MRAGSVIGTVRTKDASLARLASVMVGREMSLDVPRTPAHPGAAVLKVRDLTSGADAGQPLHDVSFDIAAGEIVGLAGIEG